jgi:ankyrin repeat protein
MYRCTPWDQEVVELLVENGDAQLDKRDCDGRTALHHATSAKCGCSLTVLDNHNRTYLRTATDSNYHQVVEFLKSASDLTAANDYYSLHALSAPGLIRHILSCV